MSSITRENDVAMKILLAEERDKEDAAVSANALIKNFKEFENT